MSFAPFATLTVTEETLEQLAPSWSELLAAVDNRWPFLRPAWLRVWLATQAPDAELLLLAVRDGPALAGVVPLLVRGAELLLAGDAEICDYMDIVARPGQQQPVLRAALSYLNARQWQRLVLWGIRADSPTLAVVQTLAPEHGLSTRIEEEAVCPRVRLPPTWEEYLLTLSKKDRHELRRKIRRMMEAGDTAREYALTQPDEIATAMPDFLRLHRLSR
ncbi:MAG TPA: hypothetical protein VK821_07145, partial [Dehalococcoidia bacterium]|nr:hypothetical protein [Dehalococcoidia bacterium]